jgi:hypothetical protein
MSKMVALNQQAHSNIHVLADKVEEQAADLHMVPVVTSEWLKLVAQFPILFTKHVQTGHFICVALMGFEPGENLFWQQAKFHSVYLPLNIARLPFFVGQDEHSGDNYVLCIDEQSEVISGHHGQSLFTADGQASDYLRNTQAKMAQLVQGEKDTKALLDMLLTHKLLVPLALDITFENGQSKILKGLYGIDEEKLNGLPADVLLALQASGYLQLIYTQIASLAQIYVLIDKQNKRQQQSSPWFGATQSN